MGLIVISFDGMTDKEFEKMAQDRDKYPNIADFKASSRYQGDVYTMFVSNTYPIHTSVATGKHPSEHGVISNLLGHEGGEDIWAQEAKIVKTKTIFDAANEKGLKVGAVAWPVTCGAKIKWNLPEVHIRKGQNRLIEHLCHGSVLFQLDALLCHRKKLAGINQPQLDDFLTSVSVDLLRRKNPDLTLIHLLAYDFICHKAGICDSLDTARAAMDANLGRIIAAAPADTTIIIFSDHGHLNITDNVNLQEIYGDDLYEQCGGSAFFVRPVDGLENQPWFGRFLTEREMDVSGYAAHAAVGIAAKAGCSFGRGQYKGNHGYPRDYEDYRVFFAVKNGKNDPILPFDDIRNVTALIAHELDLDMGL